MEQVVLAEYVKRRSQQEIADQLGVFQASVSKMVRKNRHIVLTVDGAGKIHDAYEVRKIGKFA